MVLYCTFEAFVLVISNLLVFLLTIGPCATGNFDECITPPEHFKVAPGILTPPDLLYTSPTLTTSSPKPGHSTNHRNAASIFPITQPLRHLCGMRC